jgi:protein-tyrosine phosphatase
MRTHKKSLLKMSEICKIGNATIYLGDMFTMHDLKFLLAHNIKTILNCAEECGIPSTVEHLVTRFDLDDLKNSDMTKTIRYFKLPCHDMKTFNISEYFGVAYKIILDSIKHGSILIHCQAGRSRSATIVIMFLMRYLEISFKDAHTFVKIQRPLISLNIGFENQLRMYETETELSKSSIAGLKFLDTLL